MGAGGGGGEVGGGIGQEVVLKIWSKGELNPWPPECGSGALPTELLPQLSLLPTSFFFTHFYCVIALTIPSLSVHPLFLHC